MTTSVETVLRQSLEVLNGCAMALRVPSSFFHAHYDLNPASSDENNNSDDDKNSEDSEEDYHHPHHHHQHHNNVINHNSSNSNSTSQKNVHRKSEIEASVWSSSRLGDDGEEQDKGLDESIEPDCTICYRKFGSAEDDHWFTEYGILYSCQHSFCRSCIQRWLTQFSFENRKCPVCRCQTVFCVSSPKWLPHNSPDKDSLLCCSPKWAMVQQLVRRCLSSMAAMASLHLKLSCEAFKNLVAELFLDQEGLYHRHEITSIL